MRQIFLTLCFFVGFTLSVLVGVSFADDCVVLDSLYYQGCNPAYGTHWLDTTTVDIGRKGRIACKKTSDSSPSYGTWRFLDEIANTYHVDVSSSNGSQAYLYECPKPPERTNGIKDPDEDGIDCGYDGGPPCENKCPAGYSMIDGACRKIAGPASQIMPSLVGKPHPNDPSKTVQPDTPIYFHESPTVTPILAGPNVTVPDSSFSMPDPSTTTPSDEIGTTAPDDITTVTGGGSSGNGDYVIKDGFGNVKGFRQTNESSTDNGDGTTIHYHTTTVYNPETGQNTTTTTETTTDNTTGETLSSTTSYSGKGSGSTSTGTAVQNGMGSSDGVTGDQYSSGVGTITGAVKDSGRGIEDAIGKLGEKLDGIGDGITAIVSGDDDEDDLGEFVEPVYDGLSDESTAIPDDSEYSIESLLSDFFNEYMQFGFITVFMETTLDTNSTYCSVTGSVYGSTVTLSICEYEYVFNQLGAIFSLICQLSALFITFGGLD